MEEPVGVACKALGERAVVLGCVGRGRWRSRGSVFLGLGHGHSLYVVSRCCLSKSCGGVDLNGFRCG
jgi:hypothetical protein